MQNKKYFYQGLTVLLCTSIIVFGLVYFVSGTTIGTDIATVNFSATGLVGVGTSTTAGVFTVGTSTGEAIFNITTEGNIGIGTTAPTANLYVKNTKANNSIFAALNTTVSNTEVNNFNGEAYFSGTSNITLRGGYFGNFIAETAANDFTRLEGASGDIYLGLGSSGQLNSQATVQTAVGLVGDVTNYSSNAAGMINQANGAEVTVYNSGSGKIRQAVGLNILSIQATGADAGQTHNAYGIYIGDYITASGGTTNNAYSLYSLSTAPSYITGSVGIGTSTPVAILHAYASATTTAILEQTGPNDILYVKNATGTILTIDNAGNLTSGSYLYVDQANQAVAVGTTTSSGIFNIGTSSNSILTITTEGYVGIGTTSPTVSLENSGDFITKGPWVDVRAFGAKGDGVNDDTTAIQSAVNYLSDSVASNGGGIVFIPRGNYLISDTITITRPIHLVGVGGASRILVSSSMGATTDVIKLAPTGSFFAGQQWGIENLKIIPNGWNEGDASGNARNVIAIDTTTPSNYMRGLVIQNNYFGPFSGSGIYLTAPASPATFGENEIINNIIYNGISLINTSDSVKIERNLITGAGIGINIDGLQGASNFVISENSITSLDTMIRIVDAEHPRIINNYLERGASFTASNESAMISLVGTSNPVVNPLISGNYINSTLVGDIQYNVYADNVNGLTVTDNDFVVGSVGHIILTANATHSRIGNNMWRGASYAVVNPVIVDSSADNNIIFNAMQNVGIGTSTPSAILHAYASATTTAILQQTGPNDILYAKNATGTILTIDNAGNLTSGSYLYVDQANQAVAVGTTTALGVFTVGTSTNPIMNITTGGNVGIGTTTPSSMLDVSGNITAGGGLANSAVCWKADGRTLGYCSSAVGADGTCTCN